MAKSPEYITIPSPIEVHAHDREPGQEEKETTESCTWAALMGGYQALSAMPNTKIPVYTRYRLHEKRAIAEASSHVHYAAAAGVNLASPDLDELEKMIPDAPFTKFYMGHTTGNLLELTLDQAREPADKIIATSRNLGLHHTIAMHVREEAGYETADYIARQGHSVHWCHLSTESEAQYAADLTKKYPEYFTAGVTPHHLTMTQRNADFQQGWNGARMMPPLAQEVDAEALLHYYNNGDIQILETDHAPHTEAEKMTAEAENPEGNTDVGCTTCFGVSGIEFVLPVMTALVKRRKITMERLVDSLYDQPLRMLGLKAVQMTSKTMLAMGPYVIGEDAIAGKSHNTPYVGWTGGAKVVVSDMAMRRNPRVFGAQPLSA